MDQSSRAEEKCLKSMPSRYDWTLIQELITFNTSSKTGRRTMTLIFSLLLNVALAAPVTCVPTSCSPGCDSSCDYQTCTGGSTNSFLIDKLPHSYQVKPDACEDSLEGRVWNQIPFAEADVSVNQIQSSVSHAYKICETKTNYGPACPPPDPPSSPGDF